SFVRDRAPGTSEHLARSRLEEARRMAKHAGRFHQPKSAEAVDVERIDGVQEGNPDVRLRSQIVDFIRFDSPEKGGEAGRVGEVAVVKSEARPQRIDAAARETARPADQAVDFIALFKKE